MVAKLDQEMHDFFTLSEWKKSLGASVSLENVHNYGGLAPTQILNPRNLWVFHITIPNIYFCDEQTQTKFQVLIQKESLTSWKLSQIAQTQKQNFIEVNLLENNLRWLLPITVFFFESIRILTIFGFTVHKRHFKFRVKS